MITAESRCPSVWPCRVILLVVVGLGFTTNTFADYLTYAVCNDSSSVKLAPDSSFDLEIWLVSDEEEASNSVVLQLVFSDVGLVYNAYQWHGVFQESAYDDSAPGDGDLPLDLSETVLSGPGYPAGVVDIELSNAVLNSFCVDPQNDSGEACDCPEGRCLGSVCVGGPNHGASCTATCEADEQCERVFRSGRLATLTFTVPTDYAGPDFITIDVVPDTVANGFEVLDASSCAPFRLYLACVAPGDSDCDGRVTLSDHRDWIGCMTGPDDSVSSPCDIFDLDVDGDVDLTDWRAFHVLFDCPCRPRCLVAGDVDCDEWVTLGDYRDWAACMTGPGDSTSSFCDDLDLDRDGDLDLMDWRAFSLLFQKPLGP